MKLGSEYAYDTFINFIAIYGLFHIILDFYMVIRSYLIYRMY